MISLEREGGGEREEKEEEKKRVRDEKRTNETKKETTVPFTLTMVTKQQRKISGQNGRKETD